VGDEVEVSFHVDCPHGFSVTGLEVDESLEWEILEKSLTPAPGSGGDARLRLAVFATGDVPLPGVRVRFRKPDGTEGEITPELPPLKVASVLKPGETEIAAQKPPMSLPFEVPWKLVAALGAALAFPALLWWWLRKRFRKKEKEAGPEPAVPPYEEAAAALDALAGKRLWLGAGFRVHYEELSHILRRYLERRYGLPVLERTTHETIPMLRFHPSLRMHAGALKDMLSLCDAVKFAKLVPPESEGEPMLNGARAFLEATRPQPAPAGAPEESLPAEGASR
jgi:hypothetical protein